MAGRYRHGHHCPRNRDDRTGHGHDLTGIRTSAVRDGEHYVVSGSKTFISNGQNGDLFVVAARTSEDKHNGLSLLVVEADTLGFGRGRNLGKIGLHAQNTSELGFTDMRVPIENLLVAEATAGPAGTRQRRRRRSPRQWSA